MWKLSIHIGQEMGLKWPLVPQIETRETHFRPDRFFISANLCLLNRFERRPGSRDGAGLDSELHPFQGYPTFSELDER
jgi:hypothetical protein